MTTQHKYIAAGPYQDILSGIQLILSISNGVVKLTGLEQTGKSHLLEMLATALRADSQQVVLFSAVPNTVLDMHNTITRQLNLGADLSFRKGITRYLSSRPRDQQKLILIFDNAQRLDEETLQSLIPLREIAHNDQSLVSIVLGGDLSLDALLNKSEYAALMQDIVLNYELAPLTRKQLSEFCVAAITELKLDLAMPSAQTLDYLFQETEGFPERVLQKLPEIETEYAIATSASFQVEANIAESLSDTTRATEQPISPEQTADLDVAAMAESGTAISEPTKKPAFSFKLPALPKLRMAMYGTLAVSVTAAAVFVVYPKLSPLWQKAPATTVVSSSAAPSSAQSTAEIQTPASAQSAATVLPVETNTDSSLASNVPQNPDTNSAPSVAGQAQTITDEQPQVQVAAAAPSPTTPVAALTPPPPVVNTPVPARTAISLVPSFPVVDLQDNSPGALEEVVLRWIHAWEAKDLDAYFAAYHTDFAPLYQNTVRAWRDNRVRSINRPSAIALDFEEFTVNGDGLVGTHVSFWLTYQTEAYADKTRKELVIGHDLDGNLRILQEINRQVIALEPTLDGTRSPNAQIALAATAPTQSSLSQQATTTTIAAPITIQPVSVNNAQANAAIALSAQQVDDIGSFVESWLQAWQGQDITGYFRHYHPTFKTSTMPDRASWEQDRTNKIRRPLAIQIQIESLNILALDDSASEVELLMEYHSTYYADITRKALKLRRTTAGSWQITGERNLSVEQLPLARLVPGTNFTFTGGTNTVFEVSL